MNFIEEAIRKKSSEYWSKYRSELLLIFLSLAIFLISLTIFMGGQSNKKQKISFQTSSTKKITPKIFIDLAGAVENPDVYEVSSGARLKDVIKLANGFSADADHEYVAKNLNLAKILKDQEKIYIPVAGEVQVNQNIAGAISREESISAVNINIASISDLDKLPSVGPVTAVKIISGRPYSSIDELKQKKIIGKSTFEKIKELITVQ